MPNHLRDAHYQGAKSLGHGKGYDYPHDDPEGWVDQQYRPAELEGRRLLRAVRVTATSARSPSGMAERRSPAGRPDPLDGAGVG